MTIRTVPPDVALCKTPVECGDMPVPRVCRVYRGQPYSKYLTSNPLRRLRSHSPCSCPLHSFSPKSPPHHLPNHLPKPHQSDLVTCPPTSATPEAPSRRPRTASGGASSYTRALNLQHQLRSTLTPASSPSHSFASSAPHAPCPATPPTPTPSPWHASKTSGIGTSTKSNPKASRHGAHAPRPAQHPR